MLNRGGVCDVPHRSSSIKTHEVDAGQRIRETGFRADLKQQQLSEEIVQVLNVRMVHEKQGTDGVCTVQRP